MVHLFGYTDEIFKLKEFAQQNINVPFYYFRFIYADLFGFDMWTAEEIPYMSGNFSSERVNFTCTASSPIPCSFVNSTTIPAFGYIYSFGQDNNKDVLLLASTGVYRMSDHTAVVIHAIWIHITHHRMMYNHRVIRRHQALWNHRVTNSRQQALLNHRVLRRWQHQHLLDLSESN